MNTPGNNNLENFDIQDIKRPEWFRPQNYNARDWTVNSNLDRISKPSCGQYRGDHKELNHLAGVYRFWRM